MISLFASAASYRPAIIMVMVMVMMRMMITIVIIIILLIIIITIITIITIIIVIVVIIVIIVIIIIIIIIITTVKKEGKIKWYNYALDEHRNRVLMIGWYRNARIVSGSGVRNLSIRVKIARRGGGLVICCNLSVRCCTAPGRLDNVRVRSTKQVLIAFDGSDANSVRSRTIFHGNRRRRGQPTRSNSFSRQFYFRSDWTHFSICWKLTFPPTGFLL